MKKNPASEKREKHAYEKNGRRLHETADPHTVRAFDRDLQRLQKIVQQLGEACLTQLRRAMQALSDKDEALAEEVVLRDDQLNLLGLQTEEQSARIVALRQPVANDLRRIIVALRLSRDLERMGDHAASIAKRVPFLKNASGLEGLSILKGMASVTSDQIRQALCAWKEQDCVAARAVRKNDAEIDAHYAALLRELLTYMMEDPRRISRSIHLLFIGKSLERIGDYATDIADSVYYQETAQHIEGERPRSDPPIEKDVLPL